MTCGGAHRTASEGEGGDGRTSTSSKEKQNSLLFREVGMGFRAG